MGKVKSIITHSSHGYLKINYWSFIYIGILLTSSRGDNLPGYLVCCG